MRAVLPALFAAVLVAAAGGCKDRGWPQAAFAAAAAPPMGALTSAALPTPVRGSQRFFFHWGSAASNSAVLANAHYPGTYDFAAPDLPASRSEGRYEAQLTTFQHSIYHGADAAGPGLYLSGLFGDSHFYGDTLIVVERQLASGALAAIAFDRKFKARSEAAWADGTLATLPYLVRYTSNWYVVAREPRAEDQAKLVLYPPAATDAPRIVAALATELSPFEFLRTLTSYFDTSAGEAPPLSTARIFVDRLFFDDGYEQVRKIPLASLDVKSLWAFEAVLKVYVDKAPQAAKTQVLTDLASAHVRATGLIGGRFDGVAAAVFAGIPPAEWDAVLLEVIRRSPPLYALRTLDVLFHGDLSPAQRQVFLPEVRAALMHGMLDVDAPLEADLLATFKLLTTLFGLDPAQDAALASDVLLSFFALSAQAPLDFEGLASYGTMTFALRSARVTAMTADALRLFAHDALARLDRGTAALAATDRPASLGAAILCLLAEVARFPDAAKRDAMLHELSAALLERRVEVGAALALGEPYLGATYGYLTDLRAAAIFLRDLDPELGARVHDGLKAAQQIASERGIPAAKAQILFDVAAQLGPEE